MTQDFNERGYLGEEAFTFKQVAREKHRPYFDLFEELNSFSQAKKFLIEADNQNGQQVLSMNIFIRILNGAQGVYILCGYGLAQEGQIVLRSLLEGLIILAKIVSDPSFVSIYVLEDEIDRLKLMEAAEKHEHPVFVELKDHIDPEKIVALRKRRKDQEIRRLVLADLAKEVGLGPYYDSVYRLLSPGVHFRVRSLEDYVGLDDEGEITKVEWGPRYEDIPIIFGTAMDILMRGWGVISNLFQLNLSGDIETYLGKLKNIKEAT